MFDVSRKITYKNLDNWYKELQEYRKGIPVLVVANKIDGTSLVRYVSMVLMCGVVDYRVTSKTFNFATKKNLPFYFASASDGTNVVKVCPYIYCICCCCDYPFIFSYSLLYRSLTMQFAWV